MELSDTIKYEIKARAEDLVDGQVAKTVTQRRAKPMLAGQYDIIPQDHQTAPD
jgi:hypothetical protein